MRARFRMVAMLLGVGVAVIVNSLTPEDPADLVLGQTPAEPQQVQTERTGPPARAPAGEVDGIFTGDLFADAGVAASPEPQPLVFAASVRRSRGGGRGKVAKPAKNPSALLALPGNRLAPSTGKPEPSFDIGPTPPSGSTTTTTRPRPPRTTTSTTAKPPKPPKTTTTTAPTTTAPTTTAPTTTTTEPPTTTTAPPTTTTTESTTTTTS